MVGRVTPCAPSSSGQNGAHGVTRPTCRILLILLILSLHAYVPVVSAEFVEPENLTVTVDRMDYQPDVDTPLDRPHCFVYFISIHNGTEIPVTIHGRKWVVTNTRGEVMAVEGDGVVGEHPTIEPGEKFSYNSFHLLDTKSAVAEGSYIGVDANGQKVLTRIPKFKMTVPETR